MSLHMFLFFTQAMFRLHAKQHSVF